MPVLLNAEEIYRIQKGLQRLYFRGDFRNAAGSMSGRKVRTPKGDMLANGQAGNRRQVQQRVDRQP